jgi:uncharacterized membrane protein YfcA
LPIPQHDVKPLILLSPLYTENAMGFSTILLLGAAVFSTSLISGTFGMAGGMILMVILLQTMPLQTAFFFHAAIQLVSNGWRCFLWRRHIVWRALPFWAAGVATGLVAVALVGYAPGKAAVLLTLGAVPLLGLAVRRVVHLTVLNPVHAYFAAICLTFVHLTGGTVGALLDLLYNNTPLTRHQIVATKAFTQTCSHMLRLVYFGALLPLVARGAEWPKGVDIAVVPAMMVLSIAGTTFAAQILKRFDDDGFKRATRYIIAAVSVYCLARGLYMLGAGD